VHSPEFSFEHDVDNVRAALSARSIRYPVALDNHFLVWRSFHNHFWPAVYVADAEGRIRHHSFGEGGYEETERALRALLARAGADDPGPLTASVEAVGVEAAADWDTLRSPETYLGYDRMTGFASPGGVVPDQPSRYGVPSHLRPGHWALSGRWAVGREHAAARETDGRLLCRFQARDLHLIAAPSATASAVRFRLLLDGRPPGADHGLDVDAEGSGTITEPRLHQLLRRQKSGTVGTAEIEFLDPGAEVYALTFG
jgi:hypothetical protein